jgi:hypothetical protein
MPRLFAPIVCLAACALTAGAAAAAKPDDAARLAKLLAGRTPGKPVSCLPNTRATDSTTIGSTIVYRFGSTLYVNRFINGCPMLRSDRVLVSNHPTGRACRGDLAQVYLQQPAGISLGGCAFDDFTPYPKPAR